MSRIILASGSPRRKELLSKAGFSFTVQVSHEEEKYTKNRPEEIVTELSAQKAAYVAALQTDCTEELVILGADTVVAAEGRILGKPVDREDAEKMIALLSGRKHQVFTGVTLIRLTPDETGTFFAEKLEKQFFCGTDVYVRTLSEAEIKEYVAVGESMDAAGAYKIQGAFGQYVDHIEGDYENIIGLPVTRTARELRAFMENR